MKLSKHRPHDVFNRQKNVNPALAPYIELLEDRLLLDVAAAAPVFATPLAGIYYLPDTTGKALTIGIDGAESDGTTTYDNPLTFTVTSNDPKLVVQTPSSPKFVQLDFSIDGVDTAPVILELFPGVAPTAVQRIIDLATQAVVNGALQAPDATHSAFYTNVVVHRVIPNFMIQTGDAVNGDGTGASGLADFNNEIDPHLSFAGPGVVGMANAGTQNGKGTNDSQFFITTYPYASGNGGYTILGQLIAGQDVIDQISLERANSSDKPYDTVLLKSVTVLDSDTQDEAVSFYALKGFDGDATVTITMTDDQGHTIQKQIEVKSATGYGDRPAVADLPYDATQSSNLVYTLPGQTKDFLVNITDPTLPSGDVIDANISSPVSGVTVSMVKSSGSHYLVTYSLPSDYSDTQVIPVEITTIEQGLEGAGNLPARISTFYIVPWGSRPVITGVADDEVVNVDPGGTTTKTVTITDDNQASSQLTVTATTSSSTIGATASVAAGDNNTWVITITAPSTYLSPAVQYYNGFDVTVSAVENEPNTNVTLTPTTKTFHVSTLGDPPTITGVDDRLLMTPFEKKDIVLTIADDGGSALPFDLTATSNINGTDADQQVVYVDSSTDNNNQKIYTLHIDLTKRLPNNFAGYFEITLSAVQHVASSGQSSITDAAKAGVMKIFVVVQSAGDPSLDANLSSDQDTKVAVVDGTRLFVGTATGMDVYDISDPSQPVLKGTFTTPYEVHSIVVDGNIVYVGMYGQAYYGTIMENPGAIYSVDVTDPTNPTQLGEMQTDSYVTEMTLVGTKLYVANWTSGLEIYDVSNPALITEAGWFSKDSSGHAIAQAAAVAVKGNYAYIADSGSPSGKLIVLNIADPQNISFVRQIATTHTTYIGWVSQVTKGSPSDLAIDGNKLYLSDSVTGLFVYDISNGAAPSLLGWAGWRSSQIRVQDNMAVISYGGYEIMLDVTDPKHIQKMYATYAPGYAGGVGLADSYMYLPGQTEGLAALDTSGLTDAVVIRGSQTFTDNAGKSVHVALVGPGSVRVQTDSNNDISEIDVEGTDRSSQLLLSSRNGGAVGNIVIQSAISALVMPQVVLNGNLTVAGQPRKVVLGDVTPTASGTERTISFEQDTAVTAAPRAFNFSAGQMADVQLSSYYPIGAFTAVDWLDDEGDGSAANIDTLTAPSVGSLKITGAKNVAGDMQAGLELNMQEQAASPSMLSKAFVAGALSDATWDINGRASALHFGSTSNWTLNSDGYVSSVSTTGDLAGSLTASSFGAIAVGGLLPAPITATGQIRGVSIGSIRAGNANDAVITAPGRVNGIYVGQWEGCSLTAGSLGSLRTNPALMAGADGNISANITTTGAIGSVYVDGNITGNWTAASIGSLTAAGWIRGSEIHASGSIGSITAAGMDTSDVYAGYIGQAGDVTGLPATLDPAKFSQTASIGSVQVKGVSSGSGFADSFINSNIAAWNIGSVKLAYATLDSDPDAVQFGTEAHNLGAYSYKDATHASTWYGGTAVTPGPIDNLVVRIV